MPITITDPETEALLAELGEATGRGQRELVAELARNELERVRREVDFARRREEMRAICASYRSSMPTNPLSIDEIIGYDENGLPT